MLALSLSVGADLVHTTNSPALTGVTAELQSDLTVIHASPTRAMVESGDEGPPVGDGRAQARLVLTNDVGQTLTLRLRGESDASTGRQKFRVLGYRKTEPAARNSAWAPPKYSKVIAYHFRLPSDGAKDPVPSGFTLLKKGSLDALQLEQLTIKSVELGRGHIQKLTSAVNAKKIAYPAACYDPHHIFVFYSDTGSAVAAIEICFSCSGIAALPAIGRHVEDGRLQGMPCSSFVSNAMEIHEWPARHMAAFPPLRWLFGFSADFWCRITDAPETSG